LVLGGLRGWADTGDGVVTAAEVNTFATQEMLTFPGRTQTPELWGSPGQTLVSGVLEAFPKPKMANIYGDKNTLTGIAMTPEVGVKEPVQVQPEQYERPYDSAFFASLSFGLGSELKYEATTPWLSGKLG